MGNGENRAGVKTKIIALFIMIAVNSVISVAFASDSAMCNKKLDEIKNILETKNHCEKDDDCDQIGRCPICAFANRAERQSLLNIADDYQKICGECKFQCVRMRAQCVNNKCVKKND